jgi:hypothetical protein
VRCAGRSPRACASPSPGWARIQEQRAEAEATRLALRAEADKLMRSLGHEASGLASHLLTERIGAFEAELEPVHAASPSSTQTIRILEVFDEAWAAFNAAEPASAAFYFLTSDPDLDGDWPLR